MQGNKRSPAQADRLLRIADANDGVGDCGGQRGDRPGEREQASQQEKTVGIVRRSLF